MVALYTFAQDRELERMKFQARIMGIDIDSREQEHSVQKSAPRYREYTQSDMLFKHPSEYAKMTPSERQELTERMLGKHQSVMRSTPIGRKR